MTSRRKRPLKIGTSFVVAFSPDGNSVAALGRNVVVWDLLTRKRKFSIHPFSHPSHVAFSPDGGLMAVKNTSGHIVIIDADSGNVVTDFASSKDGEGVPVLFAPEGDVVVDASWGGVLFVRAVNDGKTIYREQIEDKFSNFSSDGKNTFFYTISKLPPSDTEPPPPKKIYRRQWPFSQHQPEELPITRSSINALAISPSGSKLAVMSKDLEIVDLSIMQVVSAKPVEAKWSLAWSPCEKLLACAERNADAVAYYNSPDFTPEFPPPTFGPDKLMFYNSAELTPMYEIPVDYASDVAFSPDGSHIAVGCWGNGLVLPRSALEEYSVNPN
jgi:WD40 repeat protein